MRAAIVFSVLISVGAVAAPAPRVSLEAIANPEVAYVGQQVVIGWFLDVDMKATSLDIVREPVVGRVVIPLLPIGPVHDDTTSRQRSSVRRYAFYPEEPGLIEIPPVTVRARLAIPYHSAKPYEEVEVTSPPIRVRVRPLPPGASAAAVGLFSVDCAAMRTVDRSIVFEARVTGDGSSFDVVRPRFDGSPDFTYEITPADQVVTRISNGPVTRSRRWTVRIAGETSPRLVSVPDLVVDYFDPTSGSMRKARCRGRSVTLPPSK